MYNFKSLILIIFVSIFGIIISSGVNMNLETEDVPNTTSALSSQVIDDKVDSISSSFEFTHVGHFEEGENQIEDLDVYGSNLIVADIYDSIKVLDVSNPKNISKIFHDYPGGQLHGVQVVGNYLYTAHNGDGLQIYDISDPTNLLKYGILWLDVEPPYTIPQDVVVAGEYAYLADDFKGLQVIDVSDISNPVEVGRHNDGGDAKGVALSGNIVYLIERSGELEIIDVSDPYNPTKIGSFTNGGNGNNLIVDGTKVYIADLEDGLEIVDVSDPYNPALITIFSEGSGEANGLTINGSTLFLADGSDGLEFINITNPATPQKIGSFKYLNDVTNVFLNGSRIYLAEKQGSIDILSTEDDAEPYVPTEVSPNIIDNRIEHETIKITENNDFKKYSFLGSGTIDDPYIIENLIIKSDRRTLIDIQGTDVYFIIRNCVLDGINNNFGGLGISLYSSIKGYLVNNTIKFCSQGIGMLYSYNNKISGNFIESNAAEGIILISSNNNLISDNILSAPSYDSSTTSKDHGIGIYNSENNILKYNTVGEFRLDTLNMDEESIGNTITKNNFLRQSFTGNGITNIINNNYWSGWDSPDLDEDGIVDVPFDYTGGSDLTPLTSQIKHTITRPVILSPKSGETVNNLAKIEWSSSIDNFGYSVIYSLYISNDSVYWIPIIHNIIETSYIWNSTTFPNGISYKLKVIAISSTGLSTFVISNGSISLNNSFVISNESTNLNNGSMNIEITPYCDVISIILSVVLIVIVQNRRRRKD